MNRIKNTCIMAAMLLILCFSGCANQSSAPKIYDATADSTVFDAGYTTEPLVDGHVDNRQSVHLRSRRKSSGGDAVNHHAKCVKMEGILKEKKHTNRMPLFEDMERRKGI